MPIGLPMKGLRRNDDAMKTDAGIKKKTNPQKLKYRILFPVPGEAWTNN